MVTDTIVKIHTNYLMLW